MRSLQLIHVSCRHAKHLIACVAWSLSCKPHALCGNSSPCFVVFLLPWAVFNHSWCVLVMWLYPRCLLVSPALTRASALSCGYTCLTWVLYLVTTAVVCHAFVYRSLCRVFLPNFVKPLANCVLLCSCIGDMILTRCVVHATHVMVSCIYRSAL